ncbi:hypothetical protein DWB96_04875 [Staphylococcus caprae]|nr:hypothetical protein DWB96_04875 [Staphylococcus caprae]
MTILILLSIIGLIVSVILWLFGKLGLIISNKEKSKVFLKLLNFSYYFLIVSLLVFMLLVFINYGVVNCITMFN